MRKHCQQLLARMSWLHRNLIRVTAIITRGTQGINGKKPAAKPTINKPTSLIPPQAGANNIGKVYRNASADVFPGGKLPTKPSLGGIAATQNTKKMDKNCRVAKSVALDWKSFSPKVN